MPSFFARTAKLYQKKKYNQILDEISKLDKINRSSEKVLILAGNCYDALGKKETAVKCYQKSYKKNKLSEAALINLSIIYFEQKKYLRAQICIKKLLSINPKNCNALVLFGNIYKEKKQYQKAIEQYDKALQVDAGFYLAELNLANIYNIQKKYKKAYEYAKKALEKKSTDEEAIKLFADICIETEKPDEAVLYLEKMLDKKTQDFWIYNLLSQLYLLQKKYEASLKSGLKAVEISKGENLQHINFGYILYDSILATQNEIVKKYATMWLKKYSENSIVKYMSDSILHNEKISQNNITYVREIFDIFADDFEEILQHLNYNVPEIIADELATYFYKRKLKKMRILDAGCGTGLCGYYLKKYAKFNGLDGVDLSQKMLSVAKEKKVYSHLYNQDINAFLQQHKNRYNLINAADVFTYFGELESLFQNINISLCKKGIIVFSISENNFDDNNYYLHSSGRFLHLQKYVEKVLKENGFQIEKIQSAYLRNEGEKKVFGWIFIAQKSM